MATTTRLQAPAQPGRLLRDAYRTAAFLLLDTDAAAAVCLDGHAGAAGGPDTLEHDVAAACVRLLRVPAPRDGDGVPDAAGGNAGNGRPGNDGAVPDVLSGKDPWLGRLSARERLAVVLVDVSRWPRAAVADLTGVPVEEIARARAAGLARLADVPTRWGAPIPRPAGPHDPAGQEPTRRDPARLRPDDAAASDPGGPDAGDATGHPDLTVLVSLADHAPAEASVRSHVAACADCAAVLDALVRTARRLRDLSPPAAPPALLRRLAVLGDGPDPDGTRASSAVAARRARSRTSRPKGARRPTRAARVLALTCLGLMAAGGGVTAVQRLAPASGRAAAPVPDGAVAGVTAGVAVSASGRSYSADDLPDEVRALVAAPADATGGGAAAAAGEAGVGTRTAGVPDPAAATAAPADLTGCLTELAGQPGVRPRAVDLGSFAGSPAMVVVLPSATDHTDVYVVGTGCSARDAQVLYYRRLAGSL